MKALLLRCCIVLCQKFFYELIDVPGGNARANDFSDFTVASNYLVIPIGTTYRIVPSTQSRFLVIESQNEIVPPKRYRNEHGQLLEHSPFCERDIRLPEKLETHVESGDFEVRVKRQSVVYSYFFDFHPFDVVGWDGYLYPYALSIHDFEPITGRIHQPPPVHQTFAGQNFVILSLCR